MTHKQIKSERLEKSKKILMIQKIIFLKSRRMENSFNNDN